MFSKGDDESSKLVLNPFMEAYQMTGKAKVEGAMEFLKVLIENQKKFLLFAHHKATLDQYETHL